MTDANAKKAHTSDAKTSTSDPAPAYSHDAKVEGRPGKEKHRADALNVPASPNERAASAENIIPHEATSRLSQTEVKDAKRVSKVLKNQGETDAKVLKTALTELERLQKLHKSAAKDESAALSAHRKGVQLEHKTHMRFLDSKASHDAAVAELKARENTLNATKEHLRKQTDILHAKETEVKERRKQKAVDDREREVKIQQLRMKPTSATQ